MYSNFKHYNHTMRLEFPEKKHEKRHFEMIQEYIDHQEEIIRSAAVRQWETYDDFLKRIQDSKEWKNLEPGRVRSEIYFLINDEDKIVWAEAIRYELNDELRFDAGNIGYGIRPSERRKWYATIWLQLALEKCKASWLHHVLVTCDKDNIGSMKAITTNWWIRDSEYECKGKSKNRYWITIK